MNETLEYLQTYARFPFALQKFLQHRLRLDEAKQIVRERMEHRTENFLRVVEKSVYGYPRSPYLPLLKMAGLRLAMGRAVRGMINGEMFIAIFGLGGLLRTYGSRFVTEKVFAILLVVISVTLVCTSIVQMLERRLTQWMEPSP